MNAGGKKVSDFFESSANFLIIFPVFKEKILKTY